MFRVNRTRFLGTGLGARSYAIIEQGTISRIVEAKPDDLRVHIEEAAGISKYKERRHETETRMRHTRENLDRLTDLRDEITSQLAHLHKQAQKDRQKISRQEKVYLYKVLSDEQYSELIDIIRQGYWTRSRVHKYQSYIYESLRKEGLSHDEINKIIRLLKKYPLSTIKNHGTSYMDTKTDPVIESIRVIKDI